LVKDDAESPKRKYLDQKWKLNSEDAKEFKGFPKKDGSGSEGKVPDIVPCFALMYKFRKEYIENSCDEALADHRGYCAKFKRVLNSEVINLGTTRGVVLLWAGFTETDSAETKAEIMSFLEEDPLIVKVRAAMVHFLMRRQNSTNTLALHAIRSGHCRELGPDQLHRPACRREEQDVAVGRGQGVKSR
jgi:hypothetical protein